jgi:hypothetical protein|eukprot:scaffold2847_cov144-Alexandrium_tamarense.AAC.8
MLTPYSTIYGNRYNPDNNKENITTNQRKTAASSTFSPTDKCLKKTAADSKLIRQAKTVGDDDIRCLIKQIHGSKGILEAAQFTAKYKGKNAVRLDNQRHVRSLIPIVKNPSDYTVDSVITLVIES